MRSQLRGGFGSRQADCVQAPSSAFRLWSTLAFLSCLALFNACQLETKARERAQRWPGAHWTETHRPKDLGWSPKGLAAVRAYADSIDTAAVVIVDDGIVVSQWGATTTKFDVHSIRKSFLSALYGIAVAKGQINLNSTLEELRIDDNPPSLTAVEKQARVIDLLKGRSGIYHAALYESPAMKAEKPPRGSHPPRSYWSYNNWDVNALGTIYEQLTHNSIYQSFDVQVAQRIGMEDYDASEQQYVTGPDSIHRAYPFRMSARHMARFGLLYLRGGRWRDAQVILAQWVHDSTTAYSVADGNVRDHYSRYGYL